MKSPRLFLIFSLALIAVLLTTVYLLSTREKNGYVIIQELFENFDLKKDLEKDYTKVRNARKIILDSLQIDISILSKRLTGTDKTPEDMQLFERKKAEFQNKMQQFDQDNLRLTKEFDDKIITQLNQYISDYGKANGYDMIFGNTSNGSIMYGNEKNNITKDVLTFINQKYKGSK